MQKMILIGVENFEKRAHVVRIFRDAGFRVIEAESGFAAITLLKRNKKIALALLDMGMSDIRGVDFALQIQSVGRAIPIVALVTKVNEGLLQELFEFGISDYVNLNDEPLRFIHTVSLLLKHAAFEREVHFWRREGDNSLRFSDITPMSPKVLEAIRIAKEASQTLGPVLIDGETGTGRAIYIRVIHNESANGAGPFVQFFCNAEDPDAVESSLPDITKFLKKANNGTLCFLNIDSLSIKSQQDLLAKLQDSIKKNKYAVRFVATAGANVNELIRDGILDADLVAFFAVWHISIPALRDRREDIPILADKILKKMVAKLGKDNIIGIHSAAMVLLSQQNWPHNITELENVIFRAIAIGKGPLLRINDFQQLIQKPLLSQNNTEKSILPPEIEDCIDFFDESGHIRPMNEIENAAIGAAIKRYNGHMSEVARRLKISRSTLYRKMLVIDGEEAAI